MLWRSIVEGKVPEFSEEHISTMNVVEVFFFSTGFYSPYRTLAFLMDFSIHRHLVGLLGWGLIQHKASTETQDNTTQKHADTHPCPTPSRIRTCDFGGSIFHQNVENIFQYYMSHHPKEESPEA
jgi:hypothetical protein